MTTALRSWICALVASVAVASGQTGTPGIPAFDQLMTTFLPKYNIPGGALVVAKDGRLVMARGYGFADKENQLPVQPDSLFRIASLSKILTSVAIMHLAEEGKLSVDQPAFALLPDLPAPAGTTEDPRLSRITLRHLLTHSGGWDVSASNFDPMFASQEIALALGVPQPASTENIVRYMRGRPLDFDPGTHYRYSNFGYAVLGRIIERVTGMSYDQYVRTQVLAPMGVNARIGNSLADGQLAGEVKYYSQGTTGPNVFPEANPVTVPLPYGGWCLECMDAHGGWVISALDYAKFLDAIDGRRGPAFLQVPTVLGMTQKPNIPDWTTEAKFWYAFGIGITLKPNGYQWGHDGGLDGTTTMYTRTPDGFTVVAFFNTRPPNDDRDDQLQGELLDSILSILGKTTAWPADDYYSTFKTADPARIAASPAINGRDGVLNAASLDRGLVPGSWASAFGVNLSQTTRSWTAADIAGRHLPTSLDGVSLTVDGKPAVVSFVSPTRINFQVPADVRDGWWPVVITNNGVATSAVLAIVQRSAAAPFLNIQNGIRLVLATQPDGSLIDDDHPARPGDNIVLYATGLEPSPAGVLTGEPRPVSGVTVQIGDEGATITYSSLVAPGLFQVNAVVPDIPAGRQRFFLTSNFLPCPQGLVIPIASAK